MNISSSPDITVFKVKATIDLSLPVPVVRFTNLSSGANLANVSYAFEVYSPNNIPIHKGVATTSPDVVGLWTTHSLTESLITFQNSIEWSGYPYRIVISARDSNNTVYKLPEMSLRITQPKANTRVGHTYGEGIVDVQVSCEAKEAFIRDRTPYSYQGIKGAIQPSSSITVIQPPDATGVPPAPQIFPGLSQVAFPLYIAGEGYKAVLQSVVDYELEPDAFVRLKYIKTQNFNVNCNYDLCPLLYEFAKLLDKADRECDAKLDKKIQRLNSLITNAIIAKMQPTCGVDLGRLIEQIKEVGGWQCDCTCGAPIGMNGTNTGAAPGALNIQFLTSGDITGFATVTGNNILLTLKDFQYIIQWAASTDNRAFSVKQVTVAGATKTYLLNVDLNMLAEDLIKTIGSVPALLDSFNLLVKNSFNFSVDGKCVLVSNPACNYTLTVADIPPAPLTAQFKNIEIGGITHPISITFNQTSGLIAVKEALNGLNKGLWTVAVVDGLLTISSTANTNIVNGATVYLTADKSLSLSKTGCTGTLSYQPSVVVQAIIDYLCKINATQIKLGYDFVFTTINPDGTVKEMQFKTTDSLKSFLDALKDFATVAISIGNKWKISATEILAIFSNTANPIKSTDVVFATRDGVPGQWTQIDILKSLISVVTSTNDSALKALWCGAVNVCGLSICNPVQFASLVLRVINKSDFYIDQGKIFFSGFYNSFVLQHPYTINLTQKNLAGILGATGTIVMAAGKNKIDDYDTGLPSLAAGFQWEISSVTGADAIQYMALTILNNSSISYKAAQRAVGSLTPFGHVTYPAQPGQNTTIMYALPANNYEASVIAVCGVGSQSTAIVVANQTCPPADAFSVIRVGAEFVITYNFANTVNRFNLHILLPTNGIQNQVHDVAVNREKRVAVPTGVYGDYVFKIRAACNADANWYGPYSNNVTLNVPNTIGASPTALAVSAITTTTARFVATPPSVMPAGATSITLILTPTLGGPTRTFSQPIGTPVWDVTALTVCTQYRYSVRYDFPGGLYTEEFVGGTYTTLCNQDPFAILTQPVTATVVEGAPFSFSVSVGGGLPPYSYQWQRVSSSVGTNIAGANGTSFSKGAAALSDAGLYRVKAFDSASGTVTSVDVMLNVTAAPLPPLIIISQPVNTTVVEGSPFSLNVAASGGVPGYTYQWSLVVGVTDYPIAGATAATYTKPIANTSNTGNYKVKVMDSAGQVVYSSTVFVNVTGGISVTYGWSETDPFSNTVTAPILEHPVTMGFTPGGIISMPYAQAAEDKFLVVRVPDDEPVKVVWYFNIDSQGNIGDFAFRDAFHYGPHWYYVSRNPAGVAFTYTNPLQLKP